MDQFPINDGSTEARRPSTRFQSFSIVPTGALSFTPASCKYSLLLCFEHKFVSYFHISKRCFLHSKLPKWCSCTWKWILNCLQNFTYDKFCNNNRLLLIFRNIIEGLKCLSQFSDYRKTPDKMLTNFFINQHN